MKLFDMIESVFFISLGITFILILLLVYHFKQRVSSIEQKCDTMFELINNVVSEMNVQRSMMNQLNAPQTHQPFPDMNMHQLMGVNPPGNINVSLDNDADDEESSEEEEDDDGDNNQESGEEEEEEEDEESGEEDDEESVSSESIKLVNLTPDMHVDSVPIDDCDEAHVDDEVETTDNIDIEGIPTSDLRVEKLETTEENHLDDPQPEPAHNTQNQTEVYKRMNLPSLKALAIERGLVSDPSKMKKADLVSLFESQSA
jgi:hypothetical protein